MSGLSSISFVARFALTSAALLTICGIALAQMLSALIVERAEAYAEQAGVVAVQLGIAPRLNAQDFGGVVGPREVQALDHAMTRAADESHHASGRRPDDHPLRLKIFNSDGMVIYSDLRDIVGEEYDSDDLSRAFSGEVVSKRTTMEDPDERSEEQFQEALEVYVPLMYGRPEPVGVAEIYLPYDPVAQAIKDDTRLLYVALAGTLLAFYVLMFRMVSRASTRLRQTAARNDYLAHHDVLTDLPNRALLTDRLERAIVEARRHGKDVGVLLIDLDRFKEINDTLGHETGDVLLQQVGERISGELREMDTVARLGGDEFVVLLPEVDNVPSAIAVAQRLVDALHQPFTVRGVDLAVEASIGIACYPEHGDDQGALMQHADVAMYVAKQARETYAIYDPQSDGSSLSRITLLNELRGALEKQELVLHYQPKEELADGTVRSVEALVRWEHPTRGLLLPCEFLPVAEQTGLISALTTRVLSEAVRQARVWQEEGRDLSVSVNLSTRNLMDAQLPQLVEDLLCREGVDPDRLEVEVTETSAMADPDRASAVLRDLSRLGVAVAVDDYGTGYSSLAYLRSLPIETLKIDRSFVSRMLENDGNAVIVKSTIELAHNLGLKVVAEGVEDEATYDALVGLSCNVAQGYYLSRPLPAEQLGLLLEERQRPVVESSGSVAM